jgi:hypothetical protein
VFTKKWAPIQEPNGEDVTRERKEKVKPVTYSYQAYLNIPVLKDRKHAIYGVFYATYGVEAFGFS